MTGLRGRMVDLVWHVVASCLPEPEAGRTALRVLREHWAPPEPGDARGRSVRARLVAALRAELGPVAERAIGEARVFDEIALRRAAPRDDGRSMVH